LPGFKDYGYKTIHVKYDLWLTLTKLKLMLKQRSIDSTLRVIVKEWYQNIFIPRVSDKQLGGRRE